MIPLYEFIFCDDRNVQLVGLFVLSAFRCCIIVDEEVCTFAHASCDIPTLAFNVALQFISILKVVYVACYDKNETLASSPDFLGCIFLDSQFC